MPRQPIVLALTLSLAAACGDYSPPGPTAPGSPPPEPQANDVAIVNGASFQTTKAFAPNPEALTLSDGEASLRWVNQDGGVTHQITSDNGAFAMSGPLGTGATYTVSLTEPGTYKYHCAIHPNMVGTITVAP